MRRFLYVSLAAVNVALAGALWATPASTQIAPQSLRDCCKKDQYDEPYCCWGCCFFVLNCTFDQDCWEE